MAPTTKAVAKATKGPAKQAAAKQGSAKKAAAKKAAVKKAAPAKKAAVKKAPVKTAAKKAAPVRKASVKKPAATKPAVNEAVVKKAVVKKAPAKSAPAKSAPAKKAPAKQVASPPKLPGAARGGQPLKKAPPKRKGPLDKFLLGQVEALTEERATYLRQAASLKAEADLLAAEREPGDVQFDEESGEGDTLAVERERDLALSAQATAAVEEIDLALAKIKDGTYGVCEQCHNTIPKERLRALPYAALCVQCKSAGFSRR
jgi:RNA polymerase-binding transcription factor DksA